MPTHGSAEAALYWRMTNVQIICEYRLQHHIDVPNKKNTKE